jgi:hypothetical protein
VGQVVTRAAGADYTTAWTTLPTSLPPSGPAGGALTGSFPNPGVSYAAITGTPTSLPPSGAASLDLSGSFPGPTVARINGAALGTTTPIARGDILVAQGTTPTYARLAKAAAGQVLQTNATDTVWGAPPASAPTGSAGGSLTGTFPNPGLATNSVTATQIANLAVGTAQLADGGVTYAKLGADARLWETWGSNIRPMPSLNGLIRLPDNGSIYWFTPATQVVGASGIWGNASQLGFSCGTGGYTWGSSAGAQLMALSNTGDWTLAGQVWITGTLGSAAAPMLTMSMNWNRTSGRPGYRLDLDTGNDRMLLSRDTGSGYQPLLLSLWNGDFQIWGANAYKAAGTTWAVASDPRLKTDVTPYAAGLAEVCRLAPISYRLKAHPEMQCCGFDAAAVRDVMPECIGTIRTKLEPTDDHETEVLTFDMHPVLIAQVNATRELAARVAALEARAG